LQSNLSHACNHYCCGKSCQLQHVFCFHFMSLISVVALLVFNTGHKLTDAPASGYRV
jgi:hypothetical protein